MKRKTPVMKKTRLPIIPEILTKLRAVWESSPRANDAKMLWAASSLCFFGFMRSGEVVAPSSKEYDLTYYLVYRDVSMDCRTAPTCIQVRVKPLRLNPSDKE